MTIDQPTKNIIPIHIIEQTGGAFVSLVSLAQVVQNIGYRMILSGLINESTDKPAINQTL